MTPETQRNSISVGLESHLLQDASDGLLNAANASVMLGRNTRLQVEELTTGERQTIKIHCVTLSPTPPPQPPERSTAKFK